MYQKPNGRFVADWKDATGRRHRKSFKDAAEARAFEQKRIALSKLAVELGLRIGQGTKQKGSARKRVVKAIIEECSKIATAAALGKKPSASALESMLGETPERILATPQKQTARA